jgi:hypothetical protein
MLQKLCCHARILCAIPLLACATDESPTAPPVDAVDVTIAPSLSVMEPSEEELAQMPAAFRIAPSIFNARTAVGFTADGAYAQGRMDYFATDAEQDVTLTLRRDDRAVYSETAKEGQADFFPANRSMTTTASFSVSANCGNTAEGKTAHRAWHKFLVSGWKLLSWGHQAVPSGKSEPQPTCEELSPTPESGGGDGGGGDDPYDTGCESCQQWFWYEYGQVVDEWWECTPTDAYRCEGLAS